MKVISKLQPHVRLDTSGTLFKIYQPGPYVPVWFSRWYARHNRSQDIARVTNLYQEVIDSEDVHEKQIQKCLRESVVGLANLKTTYEEDVTCTSSIEYIIEFINSSVDE